jgi:hypothetical protein
MQAGIIANPTNSSEIAATNSPAYKSCITSPERVNNMGPGTRPWIKKPPNNIAVELEPGIPKLNKGTRAVSATVLFAVSGAAMPSGDPFPNSSLNRDHLFASLYDMNDAMVPPAPGITPSKPPTIPPMALPWVYFT